MVATPTMPTPIVPRIPDIGLGSLGQIFPIHVAVDTTVLLALFMLAALFFAVMSVVLAYHWRRFPFEEYTMHLAQRIYFAGSFLLLFVALVSILIYA